MIPSKYLNRPVGETVVTNQASYEPGEEIIVTVDNGHFGLYEWVGIFDWASSDLGTIIELIWVYIGSDSQTVPGSPVSSYPVTVHLVAPSTDGTYNVRYFPTDDNSGRLAISDNFTVVNPEPPTVSDVWVDITRPDDTGDGLSLAAAKKTIAAGLTVLSGLAAGKTLTIKAGTYNEFMDYTQIPNGADDAHHTIIRGAPGETVTLTGLDSGSGLWSVIWLFGNKQFITFDNLVLDGGTEGGQLFYTSENAGVKPSYITVQNCEVANVFSGTAGNLDVSAAISLIGNHYKILNNQIHHLVETGVGSGIHGIYCGEGGGNNLIEGNEVWDKDAGYGIQVYGEPSYDIDNTTVRGNYVHDCSGNGIIIGSGTNVECYNNIVDTVTGDGIGVNYEAHSCTVYNNSIYNASGLAIYTGASATTDTIIDNNLCLANGTNSVTDAGTNTTVGINNVFSANTTPGVVVVNAGTGDFHLPVGSPCIDAGTDIIGTDFDGNVRSSPYDVGAYES